MELLSTILLVLREKKQSLLGFCPLFTVCRRVVGGHTFLNALLLSVWFFDLLPLFEMPDFSLVVFTSCYLHLDI